MDGVLLSPSAPRLIGSTSTTTRSRHPPHPTRTAPLPPLPWPVGLSTQVAGAQRHNKPSPPPTTPMIKPLHYVPIPHLHPHPRTLSLLLLTLQHRQTRQHSIELRSRSTQANLNLDFHSSHAEARRSHSVANSSHTEDHWPSTDFFHSVNFCASKPGREGGEEEHGEGDQGAGMDEAVGISDSDRVGCIEAWTTTSDEHRTCSCTCGVRTNVSKDVIFDSKAKIEICMAGCCACNELDNNSRFELVRKRRQALRELVYDGVRRTRLLTWLVVFDG